MCVRARACDRLHRITQDSLSLSLLQTLSLCLFYKHTHIRSRLQTLCARALTRACAQGTVRLSLTRTRAHTPSLTNTLCARACVRGVLRGLRARLSLLYRHARAHLRQLTPTLTNTARARVQGTTGTARWGTQSLGAASATTPSRRPTALPSGPPGPPACAPHTPAPAAA